MKADEASVFFYGLFMDESLLATKGVKPSRSRVGYVDGFALRIGQRATLVPEVGSKAYGVLMKVQDKDLEKLYSEESVSDYVAETVSVMLPDGTLESAICYNLPEGKLEGRNVNYAKALLLLAEKLDIPVDYVRQIRKQVP